MTQNWFITDSDIRWLWLDSNILPTVGIMHFMELAVGRVKDGFLFTLFFSQSQMRWYHLTPKVVFIRGRFVGGENSITKASLNHIVLWVCRVEMFLVLQIHEIKTDFIRLEKIGADVDTFCIDGWWYCIPSVLCIAICLHRFKRQNLMVHLRGKFKELRYWNSILFYHRCIKCIWYHISWYNIAFFLQIIIYS